jgi:outer membrane immunogenic protein
MKSLVKYAWIAALAAVAMAIGLHIERASATDVRTSNSTFGKMEIVEPGSLVNWTGLYVSAGIGANFTVLGDEDGSGGLAADGLIGGARVGYDLAVGRFVGGVFGEYNWSNAELEVGPYSFFQKDSDWTAGLRGGVLIAPQTLVYVLGGYTQGDFSSAVLGGDNETFDGWTAGIGLEAMFGPGITAGLELTRTWYDEDDVFGPDSGISLDDTRAMVRFGVKFGGITR